MREIKFRAFWEDDKTMKYCHDRRTSGAFLDIAQGDLLVFGPNSVHIMQYTGLKDKNGVGVWEKTLMKNGEDWFVGVVDWDDKKGCYVFSNLGGCPNIVEMIARGFKVIGNKFENPELLR